LNRKRKTKKRKAKGERKMTKRLEKMRKKKKSWIRNPFKDSPPKAKTIL
jgi:hypothetical protein